jgi:hypothetical protein
MYVKLVKQNMKHYKTGNKTKHEAQKSDDSK